MYVYVVTPAPACSIQAMEIAAVKRLPSFSLRNFIYIKHDRSGSDASTFNFIFFLHFCFTFNFALFSRPFEFLLVLAICCNFLPRFLLNCSVRSKCVYLELIDAASEIRLAQLK